MPFAFSISDSDLENLLRYGSNTTNARMIIAAEFSKNKGAVSNIEFLKTIYHGGYGIKGEIDDFSAWYGDDGIHINRGTTARYSQNAQIIPWAEVENIIDTMLTDGTFATNVEIDEYPALERKQIAESLWYLHSDLSEEARELRYLNALIPEKFKGFPEETAELADRLKIQSEQEVIINELKSLINDYENDKTLIRFKYHKPRELLTKLEELSRPRTAYSSYHSEYPEVVPFITDDEIDENLCGGSSIEGGKGRIYDFFSAEHTMQEKVDFLKNEYGIGGSTHALSRSDDSSQDHSGKGISFKKANCTEIQMSWNIVAKRISELVRTDRYFTPEAKQQYEENKRAKTFGGIYGEYNAVKEAHPDDMVLFQVGDFFEMFGEDARNASIELDIYLTGRNIPDVGRVDMCGIPAHSLEQYTEKLREKYRVTISAVNRDTNERNEYTLAALTPEIPVKTEISQEDISDFIRNWNGDTESKRRVNEYMSEHGRERNTAEWLKSEYGADTDFLLVSYDGLSPVEVPWARVQRTLIGMVESDTFLDENERENEIEQFIDVPEEITEENFDNEYSDDELASIYGGDTAESQKQIAEEMSALYSDESQAVADDYSQYIGREINVDDRKFVVESINDLFKTVELRDITFQENTGFPIFRSESLEWLRRVIAEQERVSEPETISTETVAVYPAEENNLPYDIVVERIPSNAPTPEVGNFHISDDNLGVGGPKTKFRANMDAINLLKTLELEQRQATDEEQETLSKYVGWGGIPEAFDESKEAWSDEYAELKGALTPEEYEQARASVLNAHYTSPTVVRAMYQAIDDMGFTKGNILEPAMGVGNFFGMLPDSMSQSKLYGIELDSITGRIAKQLYPKADITVAGFETTDRRDFYDLAVGNVPFGNYQVSDPGYNKLGFPIHDYFIAKAIDQVRPGGIIAFVTSRYTLDKQSPEARKYFAQRAELLGAIRLPNTAFKANAGTEVVSDIIFLQKRDNPVLDEPDWVHLGTNKDGYAINSYFIDNPDMVLGLQTSESTQYGKQDFTVAPFLDRPLDELLNEAVQKISGSYKEAEIADDEPTEDLIPADPNVKNYSYTHRALPSERRDTYRTQRLR